MSKTRTPCLLGQIAFIRLPELQRRARPSNSVGGLHAARRTECASPSSVADSNTTPPPFHACMMATDGGRAYGGLRGPPARCNADIARHIIPAGLLVCALLASRRTPSRVFSPALPRMMCCKSGLNLRRVVRYQLKGDCRCRRWRHPLRNLAIYPK